jgi:hypothetical protein
MSLPRKVVIAIAQAVERQGGDIEDVEDLIAVWERVGRRNGERADIIRREAQAPTEELATLPANSEPVGVARGGRLE